METWAKLIHFTGGEISWINSWFQLLSWKINYDQEEIQSVLESGIKIKVTNIKQPDEIIEVKHEEANKGLRYLGVRLSLTGNDQQEYQYRLQEAKLLAGRIQSTPLTCSEAYTVYTERFKSSFFYPLAVTQFTKNQCHSIQSKVYQQLLPKLGYNCHTPLAVILGPHEYGGSNLTTLFHEQHIQHIERMIQYIQRKCFLGQLYLTSIKQYQQYIGTELPIFSQSSANFQYGEKHIIKYLWDACSSINLTFEITDLQLPPKSFANDRYIMDAFISQHIDNYTLQKLNNVQLWLRVEKMSDIFHHTTFQLHYWVSNASRQNYSPLKWPT